MSTRDEDASRAWIESVGSGQPNSRTHANNYRRVKEMLVVHQYLVKIAEYVFVFVFPSTPRQNSGMPSRCIRTLLYCSSSFSSTACYIPLAQNARRAANPCTLPFPRGLRFFAGVVTSAFPVASTGMLLCAPAALLAPFVELGLAIGLLGIKYGLASKCNGDDN